MKRSHHSTYSGSRENYPTLIYGEKNRSSLTAYSKQTNSFVQVNKRHYLNLPKYINQNHAWRMPGVHFINVSDVPALSQNKHQLHLLLNKFSLLLSFGVTLMRIFLYSEKLYRSQRVIIISHYNSLFSLPLTTFKRTILKHPKSELLKLISMIPCYMELQKTTESLYPFQFTPFKFLQWRCTDAFCNMRHIL